MKPWREVAKPHKDVLAGTFLQSDFAADISQVVNGTAPDEYLNPEAFYARTYVTEGMKQLLVTVAQRLNGKGGDPVIELKTNFGGGKTHTLLAVYHLAKYEGAAADLPGIADVLKSAKVKDVPSAKVAVIDGNVLAPNQPLKQGGLSIRTIWGNLAWQLLGAAGYAKVAESDAAGTSPGKAIIESILKEAGPCVILMDELVAYYRQFGGGDPHLDALHAAVRVARTIFLGSATSTTEQAVRGIERKQVLLGCAVPGQELSFYEDALHKMRERLQYLFCHDERYWYDTRPNLSRTMLEYKGRVKTVEARGHLETAIKSKWGAPSGIAGLHVFEDHGDVPDDITDGIRVVVLPLEAAYSKAAEYNSASQVAPSCILWPDGDRRLRARRRFS